MFLLLECVHTHCTGDKCLFNPETAHSELKQLETSNLCLSCPSLKIRWSVYQMIRPLDGHINPIFVFGCLAFWNLAEKNITFFCAMKVLVSFVKQFPSIDNISIHREWYPKHHFVPDVHSYVKFRNSCYLLSFQQRIHRKFESNFRVKNSQHLPRKQVVTSFNSE